MPHICMYRCTTIAYYYVCIPGKKVSGENFSASTLLSHLAQDLKVSSFETSYTIMMAPRLSHYAHGTVRKSLQCVV